MMKAKILPLLLLFFITSTYSKAEWVPLNSKNSSPTPPKVTILNHNHDNILLKIEVFGFEKKDFTSDGVNYQQVDLLTEVSTNEPGSPEVPYLAKILAVPDYAGMTVEVVETGDVNIFQNIKLPPARESWIEGEPEPPYKENLNVYNMGNEYPYAMADMDAPSVFRDFRISRLAVYPVRYVPQLNELQIYSTLTVKVSFGNGEVINPKITPRKAISQSFAKLYRSFIYNYEYVLDEFYNGSEDGREVMLCIMPDAMVANFQVYAEWKRESGTDIHITKFSDIGANSSNPDIIKNFIAQAYNTWEHPPTYVLIVGDNGVFPKKNVTYPNYTFPWEDYFVCVDGDDYFPEMMIGRFTNQDNVRMQIMINKFMMYEKQPYVQDTAWFRKGICCSNNAYASQVETKRFTRDMMMNYGNFISVDTMMSDGNSWGFGCTYNKTHIKNALNQGRNFVNYRGEGWTYGWYANCYSFSTSDVSTLNNGQKFSFITSIGCGAAMFSVSGGNCFGEEWLEMGTLNNPKGAAAFIGPTSNTHTAYNNRIDKGIYTGMFVEGMDTPGQALVRGKLYMYNVFGNEYYVEYHYKVYCVLGDPSIHIWKEVPYEVNFAYPNNVNVGHNDMAFNVTRINTNKPIANAQVCVTGQNVFATGYTNASGIVIIPVTLPTQQSLKVTVIGGNVIPVQGVIQVQQPLELVEPEGVPEITDFNGNNDGLANPNETCNIAFTLKNWGSVAANNVQGTISSSDQFVEVLTTEPVSFGTIAPGSQTTGNPFQIYIAPDCPIGYTIPLSLLVSSANTSWSYTLNIEVHGCKLAFKNFIVNDFGNPDPDFRMDPGETAMLTFMIENYGQDIAPEVSGILISNDPYINVIDSVGFFGTVAINNTARNDNNTFKVFINPDCPVSYNAQFTLKLKTENGFYPYEKSIPLTLPVSLPIPTDYTGPDDYGYYAYSSDDSFYDQTPVYDWYEIVETGTEIELPQISDYTVTVDLPFDFKYYGIEHNKLRISTDGWIAFGSGTETAPENTGLPNNDSINNMVAVFWDDLFDTEFFFGRILYYHDEANHRFIVEWDSIAHNNVLSEPQREVFQAILLNPVHYPTKTGDGEIIIQYKIASSTSSVTVGIENDTQDIGIQYVYNADYDATATHINKNMAIKFTTNPPFETDILFGDSDCNGIINVLDAVVTINYVVGLFPEPFCFENADIDSNGQINILDAVGTINIILGVGKHQLISDIEAPAHVFLNRNSIELLSKGNIAGLQFEIKGLKEDRISMALQGYEFRLAEKDDKLICLIFTFDNKPLPEGRIKLFNIGSEITAESLEIIAANLNAEKTDIFIHENFVTESDNEALNLTVYPNPFSGHTTISYTLPQPGEINLSIYNTTGRLVRTLYEGRQQEGTHNIEWNELNNAGSRVTPGVYICRIQTAIDIKTDIIIMLK